MYKTKLQIARDKERLKKQMEALDKEMKAIDADPIREVAHAIHNTTCRQKHDDDCSFFYDTWDNSSGVRQIYVKRAIQMLKVCDKKDVLMILDIIGGNR
jgi:hypothetical protein